MFKRTERTPKERKLLLLLPVGGEEAEVDVGDIEEVDVDDDGVIPPPRTSAPEETASARADTAVVAKLSNGEGFEAEELPIQIKNIIK